MATANDYDRPSTGPLTVAQRQRLEALQFAKSLLKRGWQDGSVIVPELIRLADYITEGNV